MIIAPLHRAGGGPDRLAARAVRRPRRARTSALLGSAALAATLLSSCSNGSGHADPSSSATGSGQDSYGSLPTFLPSNTVANDAPIDGRAGHPAVTSQGDAVRAHLGADTVLAEVAGPVVPGEGLPVQTGSTTCTWRVTLSGATARVAIHVADFNAVDHLGAVYRMKAVPGQPRIPSTAQPGRRISFELRAVMPTGEGLMRWAPNGHDIVASWDFTVEND